MAKAKNKKRVDDGGPFYPSGMDGGISLRDYFACEAMHAILGARNGFLVDVGTDNVAPWAYQVADKMIEHRKRGATP